MALVAAAALAAIGAGVSAKGTSDAQTAANRAGALTAAQQSAQSFENYLSSRGINLQQLIANDSRGADFWPGQYKLAQSQGYKGDFNAWLYSALKASPNDPIWNQIANPSGTAGAANTTLPAWAVDANGNPIQPSIVKSLVDASGVGANQNVDPSQAATLWLANHPDAKANWDANVGGVKDYYAGSAAGFGVASDFDAMVKDNITNLGTPQEKAALAGTLPTATYNQLITAAGGTGIPAVPGSAGAAAGAPGIGNNTTLDPAITALMGGSTTALGNVFDGTYLKQQEAALEPVTAANNAIAAAKAAALTQGSAATTNILDTSLGGISDVLAARTAGAAGINAAAVSGAGGVLDASNAAATAVDQANIEHLAQILGVRTDAAAAIYAASQQGAAGVKAAGTEGAQGIYNAESLKADTYAQAAKTALQQQLAQNAATRLRQGFTGGSSGSDITDARVMADALQQGAGVRAQAGVNLAGRLSDVGTNYATTVGNAGVTQATTVGQSQEQDAIAKLNAAVQLATSLGLNKTNYATTVANAGNTQATSLASAGEQDAIAQLQAKVANATAQLQYLPAGAAAAQAQADLTNATNQLNALIASQNQAVSSIGTPYNLAGADLSLKGGLTDIQYQNLNDLVKSLSSFTTTQASGPSLTTNTPGSVLNSNQIIGGAITAGAGVLGNTASNSSLMDSINKLVSSYGGTTTGAGSGVNTSTGGSLTVNPNYLANSGSVFAGPTVTAPANTGGVTTNLAGMFGGG